MNVKLVPSCCSSTPDIRIYLDGFIPALGQVWEDRWCVCVLGGDPKAKKASRNEPLCGKILVSLGKNILSSEQAQVTAPTANPL